jgi:hypothetical protein
VKNVAVVIWSLLIFLLRMALGTAARGHANKKVPHFFATAWAATRGCDLARAVKPATAVRIAGGT